METNSIQSPLAPAAAAAAESPRIPDGIQRQRYSTECQSIGKAMRMVTSNPWIHTPSYSCQLLSSEIELEIPSPAYGKYNVVSISVWSGYKGNHQAHAHNEYRPL